MRGSVPAAACSWLPVRRSSLQLLGHAMLSTFIAILIVLSGALLGLIWVWATFPQFPDLRRLPVTLSIKMWLERSQDISAIDTEAPQPPIEQLYGRI